ncbi:molybdopterin-dependent oxidoreductase [Nodularia spumigena CS-591/12]|uniref:molybdopterin-dependent oxidoreductase n=1 Tax=Nodularia spumigena TaxID=70799 RepID=UPI00232AC5A8|nr:molybdopterin-dependent oxidoreductase [Nodularia spumigena]MDB9304253.1 molybdopterin-dependent oxidoreductase [Nodularia spumigena CS-591/12]
MVVFNVWKNLAVVSLGIAVVCLGGCTETPTNEQLAVWRKEASDRNAEIVAEKTKNNQSREWNLVIQGQTATGNTETLNWSQLQDLATDNVNTIDPNHIISPDQVFKFTGISVSSLLKNFGSQSEITEITFVCYDAYQVTINIKDLLKYPIILAVAKDGQPIPREQGGPIYLIFPYTEYPDIRKKYDPGIWAFYVTHIILGTEPAKVSIGDRELNVADLDQLPQVSLIQNVGYRVWWPSGEVQLSGVRLRDVLKLADVDLNTTSSVVVRGKPPVYRRNSQPIELVTEDILKCDILLATRWGNDKQRIPASMGGPVALAFSDNCPSRTKNQRWVTFVEELIPQL